MLQRVSGQLYTNDRCAKVLSHPSFRLKPQLFPLRTLHSLRVQAKGPKQDQQDAPLTAQDVHQQQPVYHNQEAEGEQQPQVYEGDDAGEQPCEEQAYAPGYDAGEQQQEGLGENASSMVETTVGQQRQHGGGEAETEEEEPMTLRTMVADFPALVRETNVGKGVALTGLLLLGSTFYIAFQRYWAAYTSPAATRSRQVNKNKLLVEELSQFLPQARQSLTPGKIRSLRSKTGFSAVEMFRKYLWYMLRERTFDQTAVDDILALRDACALSDDDVAEALHERAQRIYDKYGTLMLNTEGMTPEGIERKATCQNLFRKLLFLTEYEPLVKRSGGAAVTADLRKIFGATDEDVERLRIVSLFDVDLEKAFGMQASSEEEALDSPSPPSSPPPKQEEPGRQQ